MSLCRVVTSCISLCGKGGALALTTESSTVERLCALTRLSAPLVISYMLRLGETFIAIYFASHLSRERNDTAIFAGISLAQMFATISAVSLFIGMSTALETLGSQFNGAENYSEVGIVLQRSIVVLFLMLVPVLVLWSFAEWIFLAIDVDKDICAILKEYLAVMVFMLPVRILSVSYRKYLICVGVTWPALYCAIVQDVVFLSSGFLFVHQWQGGVQGVAWASVLSTHCSAAFQFAVSWRHPYVQRTIRGPSIEAIDVGKIWEFVKLGTPGMIMICSEWWAYEILTLFASQISAAAVTAQTLLFNLGNLSYMTPSCIGQGTASLVGNAIGANQITLASQLGDLYIYFTAWLDLVVIIPAVYFGGGPFVRFFTDDSDVIRICATCIPVIAAAALADGVQATNGGILRGSGKQKLGAYANVACYYSVGIPLAYVLCFWIKLEVTGLFLGIAAGSTIQCSIILFCIFFKKDYIYKTVITTSEMGFELISVEDDTADLELQDVQPYCEVGEVTCALLSDTEDSGDEAGTVKNILEDEGFADEVV